MVIKNNLLATECETESSHRNAVLYMNAIHHTGPILLYKEHLTKSMLMQIMIGERQEFIDDCLEDPRLIPVQYRRGILKIVEQKIIDSFVETNDYYRMLLGLPPVNTPEKDYLFFKKETYETFEVPMITVNDVERYPAIHEMDTLTQDMMSKTDEFKQILIDHPNDEWLKFIGKNKIHLEQARSAKEFEIIRLFPEFSMDINPELTTKFSNEYNRAREWFVSVMWNADLEDSSLHYRQFVSFCITIKALRATLNRQFDGIIDNSFLNETLVTILFDLYRLPQTVSQLSKSTRRRLALELRKLIRDRAGNQVLYDIARILGYDNIIISKIILNKFQKFEGENEEAVHAHIDSVKDPATDISYPVDDPYHSFDRGMQAIDLKTKSIRDDILQGKHPKDYVLEVTGPDPRWWEDHNMDDDKGIYPQDEEGYLRNQMDDIKRIEFNPQMFKDNLFGNPEEDRPVNDPLDNNYDDVYWNLDVEERRHPTWYFPGWNTVDTKYMMLTYQFSMSDKIFEIIYLMRYLLDKQQQTGLYFNQLDKYGGDKVHSLYDLVLFLVCGINRLAFGSSPYEQNEYGEIINNDTGFRCIMGFNVDLTSEEINAYLNRCDYLDADYVKQLIEETNLMEQDDVKTAYAIGILGLRDYLVTMMEKARTITEWREANKFYDIIFNYDPVREIHAKPGTNESNKEQGIPNIRYKIYDMEVSLFGDIVANIGDEVRITLKTLSHNISQSHDVVVGFVSAVDENHIVTEVNFRTPNAIDNMHALPVWNNPKYNKKENINLISDNHFDIGDLYNPSGQNGPSIEEGSYPARVGKSRSNGIYIRVTETWYHTRDIYTTYLDELTERDPFLADYISGKWSDKELIDRLNEACDLLSEITDQDLRFLRVEINGLDQNNVLMDLIKYIKSYTIDFITSEEKYILNDKRNPEWIKLIDRIDFDPHKPFVMVTREELQLYDAIRRGKIFNIICDGKRVPKDETDIDAFTHGENYMRDQLIKIPDKRGIVYYYEIIEAKAVEFNLPETTQRGDQYHDTWVVHAISGEDYHIPVEIYVGNNPTPGMSTTFQYQYSGFDFRSSKLAEEPIPIMIKINDNQIPYALKPDMIPEYGVHIIGENKYSVGEVFCAFTRVDTENPQVK